MTVTDQQRPNLGDRSQGTYVLASDVERFGIAAVMLAQLRWLTAEARHVRWVRRDGHQWIAYADNEWAEVVGLSTDQARRARRKLTDAGVIASTVFKKDGIPTVHVRLTGGDSAESDSAIPPNENGDSAESMDSAIPPNPPLSETGETTEGDISSASAAEADRPEVRSLCEYLADRIEANGSNRPPIGKTWFDACRLMIDRDGRTPDQIRRAIDWCQDDEFWRANVMSMPTLRRQFDTLRLRAKAQGTPRRRRQSKGERALEVLAQLEGQHGDRLELAR